MDLPGLPAASDQSRFTRRYFLTLAAATPLLAAEAWEKRAFPDWDTEITHRILTNSPWAKEATVPYEHTPAPRRRLQSDFQQIELPGGFGLPSGRTRSSDRNPRSSDRNPPQAPEISMPVRTELNLIVRWSSALPIRQALAFESWGRAGIQSDEAREFLRREETDYVVEVCGFPAIMFSQDPQKLERQLLKSARLWVKDRKASRPSSAHVPEQGNHMSAELRFPRSEPISVEDGVIELAAEVGQSRLSQKFKSSSMFYQGRLEL
jgi:hypothetical protein